MSRTRREFLCDLGHLAIAGAFLHPLGSLAANPAKDERSLLPDQGRLLLPFGIGKDGLSGDGMALVLDFRTRAVTQIPMPTYAHSLLPIPYAPGSFLGIPKQGKRLSRLDLGSSKAVSSVSADDDHIFFGHGAFSPDGKTLVTTEHDAASDTGQVVLRDPITFRARKSWPSHGGYPHECRFSPDGKALLLMNSGYAEGAFTGNPTPDFDQRSHLAWIDHATGKLLKRRVADMPTTLGHFLEDERGWILGGGYARAPSAGSEGPGLVGIFDTEGVTRILRPPAYMAKDFQGDVASVVIQHREPRIFALSRSSRRLFCWDYRAGTLVASSRVGRASSLAWASDQKLLVTWDMLGKCFLFLEPASLAVVDRIAYPEVGAFKPGPHFFGPM